MSAMDTDQDRSLIDRVDDLDAAILALHANLRHASTCTYASGVGDRADACSCELADKTRRVEVALARVKAKIGLA